MDYQYILLSASCFLSFLNFVSLILLSNAIFRLLVPNKKPPLVSSEAPPAQESGLIDLKQSSTYDPRFASRN